MPGSTRTATRSSFAALLASVRSPGAAAALPLLAAHLALALAGDPAKRPFVTLGVLAVAFAAYVWAARRLEATAPVPLILLIAILLRMLLLPLPPTLSDDTLRYVWDGKVVRAGFDPYLLAPEAPELAPLRDELWERMPHQHVPTVYPPLALALFSAASVLPWPLLGIKILLSAVEIVGCWLLIGLARRLGLPPGRAVWYCWNPLVALEVAGMGHVDAAVVTASVAAVWLLVSPARRAGAAGAAAAAGVLAKLVPLVALPMWARQSGRPARFLAAALGLTVLACAPVAVAAGGVPPGLVTYGVSWEFNGPLYEPLWRALDALEVPAAIKRGFDGLKRLTDVHEFWNLFYPWVYPQLLAKLMLAGVFAVFFFYSLRQRHPVAGTGALLGGFVICAATVYPWYLLWVLPWAALARHRAWLTLSALMPLAYLPQLSGIPLFPWIHLAIWAPFFLLLVRARWTFD